jgi:hypothetical protein
MSQRFYAWFDPRDAEAVAVLEAALRERHTPLVPLDSATVPTGEPGALVIFLSDHLLESEGNRLGSVVESWQGSVVPVALVSLDRDVPPAVSDISWIEAHVEPAEAVASRIALGVRTSPHWLLAWQEVRAAAERIDAAGKPAAPLGQLELDRATATIAARPQDLLPEVPVEIQELLHESRRAIRRRRRRRLGFALATVLVLVAVGTGALLQRRSATVAKAHAQATATHSKADRFSRLAEQGLATDPDLPVLFARRAYRLDPAPGTRESLRRALDAEPWHRSYRLRMSPLRLIATPRSPLVVVIGDDGSATLLDSRTGRRLARAPRPPGVHGTPVAAASGDGRSLALAYDGGLVQIRTLDRDFRVVWSRRLAGVDDASSRSITWLAGGGSLLTAWGSHAALRLGLPSGRAEPIRGSSVAAPIAVSTSADGRLLALAGPRRIAIVRAATMRTCWSEPKRSPGEITLVFDDRHSTLFVARTSSFALQIPIPERCGMRPARQPELSALIWSEGDAAAALPGGGVAAGDPSGRLVLLEPPAIYPAAGFLADTSAVEGVGVASGDSLVTVGADRWLRVWRPPALPAYPLGPAWNVSFNDRFGESGTRATWRSMIASNERGSTVTLGGLSSGSIAVLPVARLGDPRRSFFVAIDSSIRPAGASPCAALEFNGRATLFRCAGNRLHVVWSHQYSEGQQALYQSALSKDGRLVALARFDTIELTEPSHGPARRFELNDLQALAFDRSDDLFAVGGDGTILEAPTGGGSRSVAVPLGDRRLAAAGVAPSGERALLIGMDGEAIVADTANGRVLAHFNVGTDLSSAIDVRFAPDGALAAIVGRDGYQVVDMRRNRLIASGDEYSEREIGAQPRDATFLGPKRSLLVLRADEGLTRVDLAPWRFLDGEALLRATAAAVPRPLGKSEARRPTTYLERR